MFLIGSGFRYSLFLSRIVLLFAIVLSSSVLSSSVFGQTFSEQMSSPFADWSLDGQASTFTESLLSFSRTALNFGSVRSGLTSSRRFTISNFTNEDVALALNKTGSDRFRLSTSTVALSRSREASVEVTFVAAGPGAANGSVAVNPQGSNATLATILLAGSTPSGPAP